MGIDWHGSSVLGIAIFVVVGVLFGLAGRRWRMFKALAVVLPLIAAIVPLLYFVLEGNVSACTGSGSNFRCVEMSYASTWSVACAVLRSISCELSAGADQVHSATRSPTDAAPSDQRVIMACPPVLRERLARSLRFAR